MRTALESFSASNTQKIQALNSTMLSMLTALVHDLAALDNSLQMLHQRVNDFEAKSKETVANMTAEFDYLEVAIVTAKEDISDSIEQHSLTVNAALASIAEKMTRVNETMNEGFRDVGEELISSLENAKSQLHGQIGSVNQTQEVNHKSVLTQLDTHSQRNEESLRDLALLLEQKEKQLRNLIYLSIALGGGSIALGLVQLRSHKKVGEAES